MALLLLSCGFGQPKGEWFGLQLEYKSAGPALAEVSLVSSTLGVAAVEEVSHAFYYPPQMGLRIPETVDFHWRIEGETELHNDRFHIRARIKPRFLAQALGHSESPDVHVITLSFRVKDDKAECNWYTIRGGLGGPGPIYGGIIKPDEPVPNTY